VLVLDGSGDEKTGTATCGVKRQYVGCAGNVANTVNFVNATYSSPRGHALVGSRLYMPAEQLADDAQRTALGIPSDLEFKTKPQLGAELLADAVTAGIAVPCAPPTPSTAVTASYASTASSTPSAMPSACRPRSESPCPHVRRSASTPP
jgi:hypothetical protein